MPGFAVVLDAVKNPPILAHVEAVYVEATYA